MRRAFAFVGDDERVVALRVRDQPGEQRGLADGHGVDVLGHGTERAGREEEPLDRGLHAVRALPEVDGVQVLLEDLVFEYFSLSRNASTISRTLRLMSRFDVRIRFFTSCWVIVEPPCSISPDVRFFERGTEHRVHVDAVVVPERLVLDRDDRVLDDLRHLRERDVLAVDEPELGDHVALRVEDGRALREVAEPADLVAGVVVARDERLGARDQRREAGADGDTTDDDGRDEGARSPGEIPHDSVKDCIRGPPNGIGAVWDRCHRPSVASARCPRLPLPHPPTWSLPTASRRGTRCWAAVAAAQADDPLAPVTVAVPSPYAGLSLRRDLGRRSGLVNVRFMALARVAELLGAPVLAGDHRRPLTPAVRNEAVHAALVDDAGPFSAVVDHPSTAVRLGATFLDLRRAGPDADHAALATLGPRAAAVGRLSDDFLARTADYYDEDDLLTAAADAVAAGGPGAEEVGHVVVWLPTDLTPAQGVLVEALRGAAARHGRARLD